MKCRSEIKTSKDVLDAARIYIWAAGRLGIEHAFSITRAEETLYQAWSGYRVAFLGERFPDEVRAFIHISVCQGAITSSCFGAKLRGWKVKPSDTRYVGTLPVNGMSYAESVAADAEEALRQSRTEWRKRRFSSSNSERFRY